MSPKNILIATGIYPPQIGGPATYTKLLADKLPAHGFSVTVVNFGDVLWLPKVLRHVVYFLKVLWYGISVEVIYAQDPASVGLPAMLAAKTLRKKFYLKVVGDYAWEQGVQRSGVSDDLDTFSQEHTKYSFFVRLLKRIQLHVAMSADKVVTPSEYLKKIVTNWGISADKVTVIYNGFNPPVLSEDKIILRKKLGISGYALLSIGRLVSWKGFMALIEIMPDLVKQIPNVHLFIVGEGPDKKVLNEKITELQLVDSVTLVGKLTQEKLFEYIKASDVFVLNTAYEGFSHQLLEVMALGTPIVTTPAGGNIEIVKHKKNGILVGQNNLKGFEEAVVFLNKDKEFARTIAMNAKETVATFGDERMLDAITEVLSSN